MKLMLLAASVAAFSAVGGHHAAAPRPLVIFVHGRTQLGADTTAMRRQWESVIDSGLVAAGEPALRDEDVRLAWYADALDPESDADCAIAANDTVGVTLGLFARSLVSLMAADSTQDTRDVRSALSDIFFVMDRGKRCAADQAIARVVDSVTAVRPVIIVAYSLGSVVTYDYLRTASRDVLRRVHLITLGSPLGVSVLRELLLDNEEATAPDGLASWENVYDPDDDFSAPLHLSDDTTRWHDRPTARSSRNMPHDVTHYLADPSTIDALKRALHSAS
jgi:hypothetical protein